MGLSGNRAEAASIPIFYGCGPEFERVYDVPTSLLSEEGNPLKFGVSFKQFSLFHVPIWNYGQTEYAVYDSKAKTIYELDEADVAALKEEYGWELPEKPGLSFWNRIGGKLVLLGVVAAWFGIAMWKGKRRSGETQEQQPEAAQAN